MMSYPTIYAFQAIVMVPQAMSTAATDCLTLDRLLTLATTLLLGRVVVLVDTVDTSHQSVDPSPVARSDLDE